MIPLCAACRASPAAVFCHADAAHLCTSCDYIIHEANKLSRRHTRTPLSPESSSFDTHAEGSESSGVLVVPDTDDISTFDTFDSFATSELDPFFEAPSVRQAVDQFVPELRDDRLACIADACVKKEAETLLQSSGYSLEALVPQMEYGGVQKRGRENAYLKGVTDTFADARSGEEISCVGVEECVSVEEVERMEEQRRRERKAALERFRTKRANRSFRKKVRYHCRKQLADSRPRVKGRFVGRKVSGGGRVMKKALETR